MMDKITQTKVKQGKQVEVFKTDIKIKDFYNYYSNKTFKTKINKYSRTDKNSPYFVSLRQYSEIINFMNKEVVNLILHDAFEFKMPSNLGSISIRKKKVEPYIDDNGKFINPLPIDRKATKELWDIDEEAKNNNKKVYHYNEHSDGYIAKGYYNKQTAKYVGKGKYFIKLTRSIKQEINKIMTNAFSEYDFYSIK